MQLILETETTVDIKTNMSSLDETLLDEKHVSNGIIKDLNNVNNKILQSQDNVIDNEENKKFDDCKKVDSTANDSSTNISLVVENIKLEENQAEEELSKKIDADENNVEAVVEENNVDNNTSDIHNEEKNISCEDIKQEQEQEESQNDIVLVEEEKEEKEYLEDDKTTQLETVTNHSEKCSSEDVIDCDNMVDMITCDNKDATHGEVSTDASEIMEVDKVIEKVEDECVEQQNDLPTQKESKEKVEKISSTLCTLSNTLNILSDDEDDASVEESKKKDIINTDEKQCISIEDDDDVMLIDEDTNSKEFKNENVEGDLTPNLDNSTINLEDCKENEDCKKTDEILSNSDKELAEDKVNKDDCMKPTINEKSNEGPETVVNHEKPLVPEYFLKSCKKNLADMTRDDLEEFCILKIVEGIVDRSNLSEIRAKIKMLTQNLDEYKKKAMMLTKQNRDLQVVLKSVQEEQKKATDAGSITPLKITRSVGMQVLMTDGSGIRRKSVTGQISLSNSSNKTIRNNMNQSPRPQKPSNNTQQIPVPRLVPAQNNSAMKTPSPAPQMSSANNPGKTGSPIPNGVRNSPPVTKTAEKRGHSRLQSVTVDLTDDEPPTKLPLRNTPVPPVRLVPPQNLLAPQRLGQSLNSPRKVYIPISGPQGQAVRPRQTTIMLKTVPPNSAPRQRCPPPHMVRMPQNAVRLSRIQNSRHPAPLPDAMKQYQPPNWKALPPAPDLKLSKVENGIVISWKIEGFQEDSYEEIASYQLYAYQETSSPPSTTLWKKIGDVKALPLPMACTLTQFMTGYKYYFAVRAVDIRSRLGPFSLPGSILLLNKI